MASPATTIATIKNARRTLKITRRGTPKKLGGRGVAWRCNCRPTRGVCFHLLTLWNGARHHAIPDNFKVTVAGAKVLGLRRADA